MDLLMSKSFITFFILLAVFVFLLYKYFISSYDHWKKRNIPYIQPSFPFGNCIDMAMRRSSIGNFVYDVYKKCNGEMVGFWIFNSPFLLIKSQRLIRNILVNDFNYFADRSIVSNERAEPIISKILFILKNPEWKLIRKKVTSIFTPNKLKNMTTLINEAAGDLNKYLKKNVGVLEVKEICSKYTTDLLTSCAFGVNAHCFDDDQAPFRQAGRKMVDLNLINEIRFNAYFMLPNLVKLLRMPMFDPGSIKFLESAFLDTIKQRELSNQRRNDLIDIIIKLKKEGDIGDGIKFDGDHITAQAIQFYFAGFETTACTINFMLYELALHRDIQEKAREEINETLKQHQILDYAVLQNMKYLEKVILETLRKNPVVPFLERKCLADYKDPELDVVIPNGTPIYISIMGIHQNPEFYPNPEKFDPERFSEVNVENRLPFTYFPFGEGPRNCIGDRFAMIAAKLSLVHILKDFELEPCEETPVPLVFSPGAFYLEIKGGIPLRINKI